MKDLSGPENDIISTFKRFFVEKILEEPQIRSKLEECIGRIRDGLSPHSLRESRLSTSNVTTNFMDELSELDLVSMQNGHSIPLAATLHHNHPYMSGGSRRSRTGRGGKSIEGRAKPRKRAKRTLFGGTADVALQMASETIAGVKDLRFRLDSMSSKRTHILVAMYVNMMKLGNFRQFLGALKIFQRSERSLLPRDSYQIVQLMEAVEKIEDAHFALFMCRGVGLIRILKRRAQIARRITPIEDSTSRDERTESLKILVKEACASGNCEDDETVRNRIRNHLCAGKFWYKVCAALGFGGLAFIPGMSHCT